GLAEEPPSYDRLHQRHRRGVLAGRADDRVGVAPVAAGAAARLRHQRQREAALFERGPQLVGPGALLGRLDQLLGDEVVEEPGDRVGEQRAELAHAYQPTWGPPRRSPTPPSARN